MNEYLKLFKPIEDKIPVIKRELNKVINDMVSCKDVYDWVDFAPDGWTAFPIFSYPEGNNIEGITEKVPLTAHIIKHAIPNHGTVALSRLLGNNYIKPHCGFQGDFLRYHLGLKVPKGDLGLRVIEEDKIYRWEEGKSFIFDDRKEHEAWNYSDEERIVLIIDFIPPVIK